jgi:uncharacterized protein with PQ loop repeat
MANVVDIVGYAGTALVALGYLPQIWHLATRRCAMGVSIATWSIWLFATSLILISALTTGQALFIVLVAIHLVAISVTIVLILFSRPETCEICLTRARRTLSRG